ncbi:MAG: deoxyguanosinetriphosphate triphosphohydrolase [Candidatus Omnitrophica bacterium]|nr:deoxyguanosinetriphosphate triphosphohydrolase [Candidatus Omnitrophota bacterium]
MLTREDLEQRETAALAPYACRAREGRGRKHPESEHPYRTSYQRDRDRIIHSTAFRRLEYKTQVFVNHEGDHYRTRLTHSLEAAQIGRTIARALGLNEDLVEAVILAHDLGHGPFGHAGQDALHALMRQHGGFEHNLQTLRIIDLLETRYQAFPGLNLTFEVREGILKHLFQYSRQIQKGLSEFGHSSSPSLEAQVANIADEIAYDSHDLDDGFRSGLLSDEVLKGIPLWRRVTQGGHVKKTKGPDKTFISSAVRRLIDLQVTNLLTASAKRIRAFRIRTPQDVRRMKSPLIGFSRELVKEKVLLKKGLWEHLYMHYRVARMSEKGKRVIRGLFNVYLKDRDQIPPQNRKRENQDGLHRIICDYIAGMTDRFALDEYRRLFDPFEKV